MAWPAQDVVLRSADPGDLQGLLPLVHDLHVHEGIASGPERVARVLGRLLGEPGRGRVLVAQAPTASRGSTTTPGPLLGYIVVGFGYSIEFGGVDAFVDELYVVPGHRGRGLGAALLGAAQDVCRAEGVACLHLEVDHANPRAHSFYARLGFTDHARHLMTKRLA